MTGKDSPHILLLEPDLAVASQVRKALADHYHTDVTLHCVNLSQVLMEEIDRVDLVLAEAALPDAGAMEAVERLLSHRPDVPIIVMATERDHQRAVPLIERGVYDYLIKAGDYLFTLPILVQKNLAIWQTRHENFQLQLQLTHTLEELRTKNQQLEEVVKQLETAAATDPLTGLANRRAFDRAMEQAFAGSGRYGYDLSCIMIDVDGFKPFNDTFGHQKGDELLQRLARVLEANCRRSDVAGRYGGDEFILLLPETDIATARLVAKRVTDEFELACAPLFAQSQHKVPVHLSMGLTSLAQGKAPHTEALVAQADHALYRAKQSGRARLSVYVVQDARHAQTG